MGNINIIVGADRYMGIHRQDQENEKDKTYSKQSSGGYEEYIVQSHIITRTYGTGHQSLQAGLSFMTPGRCRRIVG